MFTRPAVRALPEKIIRDRAAPMSVSNLFSYPEESAVADSNRVLIGLLADPDLPSRLAQHLGDDLPAALARTLGPETTWETEVLADPFEAMYPDHDQLIDKARERVHRTPWDLALCVTDLPMQDERGVLVANVDVARRVVVISLPALGGLRLRRRVADLALAITIALWSGPASGPSIAAQLARRLPAGMRVHQQPPGTDVHIFRGGRWGVPTLLAGMVRANRPWQLIIGLSTALAGAMAGTAFGVLYSTVWQLATSLSGVRLAGISLAALTTLTIWIIAGHGLWEPRPLKRGAPDSDRKLRNAGTVTTIAVGTTAFFGTLYVLALAAVALVVPPDYLAAILHRPAQVPDYLAMALLATVLGTVAGAVGSGLENDLTVRKAAYNHRERERRRRAEQQR
ncbi:hypothetical protein ACIA8C_19335 [Nocardia sp. NPDC051321]|uniref:hypothetical protein n=1 Tax=Nocardia sp. NPDC051321 TaxID=3364323 RepID=UPI0037BC5D32